MPRRTTLYQFASAARPMRGTKNRGRYVQVSISQAALS
jgi:hypothetical protein